MTATTLNGAITATDTLIRLTSGTGAVVGRLIKIDNEYLLIQNIDLSPSVKVARGQRGSLAVDHATLATVNIGTPDEFSPIAPPAYVGSGSIQPGLRQYTYGAAGALTVAEGTHVLKTGTAGAMTLVAPTGQQNNTRMRITAATAHAYTVTYTTGFNGGGAGADVATFGGAIGDTLELEAINNTWFVIATRNVTIA